MVTVFWNRSNPVSQNSWYALNLFIIIIFYPLILWPEHQSGEYLMLELIFNLCVQMILNVYNLKYSSTIMQSEEYCYKSMHWQFFKLGAYKFRTRLLEHYTNKFSKIWTASYKSRISVRFRNSTWPWIFYSRSGVSLILWYFDSVQMSTKIKYLIA